MSRGSLLSRSLINSTSPRPLFLAMLGSVPSQVFKDSGADANFIDHQLAKSLNLELIPLSKPLLIWFLNNQLLHKVQYKTRALYFAIDNYWEETSFLVIQSPSEPLVLGISWLEQHNPHIQWVSGKILGWSNICLRSAPVSASPHGDPEAKFPDISKVSSCYLDL